jgi:hypothetical protein
MHRGTAQQNLIGFLRIGSRQRARVAFRVGNDGLELRPRPRGHIERNLAAIALVMHIDCGKPLLESVPRWRHLPERGLGRAGIRNEKSRDREPAR